MKKLVLTEQERVFRTPRMEGVRVTYSTSEGEKVLTHTIIRSKASVAVICRKDGKIAFIRQFRSTTGEYYMEIPAGLLEEGETEQQAAVREVREESGLLVHAEVLVKGPSLLDPSKSDENYGVCIADVYGAKGQVLDEMEQIDEAMMWLEEQEVHSRLLMQLQGKPFDEENNLFLSGHSVYALMAYFFMK